MKFLKCLIAFKGRGYTYNSSTGTITYEENQNLTHSWVMRPGDSFIIYQHNYWGYHDYTFTRPDLQAAYSRGDFFGRCNETGWASNNPVSHTALMWRVTCMGDDNDNIWLNISVPTTTHLIECPLCITRVDHSRPSDRIKALQSFIDCTDLGGINYWDLVPNGRPVPNYQAYITNGIIKTPKLFYNQNGLNGPTNNSQAGFVGTSGPNYRIAPHLFPTLPSDKINITKSLLDLEKKIQYFLGSVGCTATNSGSIGTQLTSSIHMATDHIWGYLWCGGMMATPPKRIGGSKWYSYYCDDVLTLIASGSSFRDTIQPTQNLGSYINITDDKNNLSGWCIPQRRNQYNSGGQVTVMSGNEYLRYKAGIFNNYGNATYFTTSLMGLGQFDLSKANSQLNIPSPLNNQADIKSIPCYGIINSYETLKQHMKYRWSKINGTVWDTGSEVPKISTLFPAKSDCVSLRDIQDGTPTGPASPNMGTWGSFGILVSTYNIASGNNINNATQVYSPISCLITPSVISDFPALDIYGLQQKSTAGQQTMIQSDGCFQYGLKSNPTPGSTSWGGIPGARAYVESVDIFKTISMSEPNRPEP